MKFLSLFFTLLFISFNLEAARQISGEEIVNSLTGVKVINVPAAALSAGVLSIDGSGNLSSGAGVSEDPTGLTALAQASWASGDLFKIWDLSASAVKKTSVADFDGRYVLQSQFNSLFDTQLATKTTDNLTEGVTNLYFTAARAQAASISQVITNGITTKSPSEDAVFDALALKQNSLGFTPEDVANKSTSTSLGTSDTLYPSQNAVKTYVDAKVTDAIVDGVTTVAPSQNAVFDALALKQNLLVNSAGLLAALSDETGAGFSVFSASPTFTGSPLAPTQSVNDNSTKIATTAYADAKVVDAINDSITTIAPSENAVFDALALKTAIVTDAARVFVNKNGIDASCVLGRRDLPCLTIQKGLDLAAALPSTLNTPVEVEVSPGKYSEDLTISQQGVSLVCVAQMYHTSMCQLNGGITVNLSGIAGGGNFSASTNHAAIMGFEVFATGAKNGLLFSGTAFQRLLISQCYINQSTTNSANSALLMSNTGSSGGVKSTIVARDTDFTNNSSTNATIEVQAGRLFDNGSSLDISNSTTTRTALLVNGSAAAGPAAYIDHASITGVASLSDNTAILQYSLVSQSCGTSACVTTPATPNTGFFLGGDNIFTTTNTNVFAGSGVVVLSGSNFLGSTGIAIVGTITQAPLEQLPQGKIRPSGVLVSGLTASKLVKTDASKNLISYDLVSGDITTALGFTPENVANKDIDGTLAANSDTKYASQKATKTYVDTGLALKQNLLTNSAGLLAALSDETGTGFSVFSASPTFTGIPLAPTASQGNNSTQLATTAYVDTGLATKQASLGFTAENVANKSDSGSLGASTTLYPTQRAAKQYVDDQIALLSGGGITSLNGLIAPIQIFAAGSSGTTPAFVSSVATHTLNIPLASDAGVTSGTISKTDYDAFTAKQDPPTAQAKSANFTAAFNFVYIVTGAVDIQLPSPSASKIFWFKKVGSGTINLVRAGSEKIENIAADKAFTSDKESIMVVTDGTDWFII